MEENKRVQGLFVLIKKRNLAKDIYDFTILAPEIAENAKAGQFVHIGLPNHSLRRPISICAVNKAEGTIRIVFAVRGEGTKDLATVNEGTALDVLGSLGHGFTLLESDRKVLLVGGGIGVPPLQNLSRHYGSNARAICGFRDGAAEILRDEFEKNGTEFITCTDDGSKGVHGLVTVPLEDILKSGEKFDMIYTCGPTVMMSAVSKLAEKYNVPCEVSLEQRMGCGLGACLVCSCKIKTKNGEDVLRVCKDGPVFNAEEVIW